jgi:hypothetical protein
LAFGLAGEIRHARRTAGEIAAAARPAGGVGFAAHPFYEDDRLLVERPGAYVYVRAASASAVPPR